MINLFRNRGIKSKVISAFTLMLIIFGAFIAFFFPEIQEKRLTENLETKMRCISQIVAQTSAAGLLYDDDVVVETTIESIKNIKEVKFATVHNILKVEIAAFNLAEATEHLRELESDMFIDSLNLVKSKNEWIIKVPIFGEGERLGLVNIGVSLASLNLQMAEMQYISLIITGTVLLLGIFFVYLSVSKIFRPLKNLQDTMELIIAGEETEVKIYSTDEIGKLAKSFKFLMNKIKSSIDEVNKKSKLAEEAKAETERNRERAEKQEKYLSTQTKIMLIEMDKLAVGDLTAQLHSEIDDEIGKLFSGFNKVVNNFRDMLNKVSDSSGNAVSTSEKIFSSTIELSAGTEQNMQQTNEVAGAVEEMARTIEENTSNSIDAAEDAKMAGNIAREGGQVIESTIEMMKRINKTVLKSDFSIRELGESSGQINEIVKVIDEIADQTNLLALNAAIEAARAGEQGRGFAVVADEVKKLAEKTISATKGISHRIDSIQKLTNNTINVIAEGKKEVEQGEALANKAGDTLKNIIISSEKVASAVSEVAKASRLQEKTSKEINNNISSIREVYSKNLLEIQQINYSVENLNNLLNHTRKTVNQFYLGEYEMLEFMN